MKACLIVNIKTRETAEQHKKKETMMNDSFITCIKHPRATTNWMDVLAENLTNSTHRDLKKTRFIFQHF